MQACVATLLRITRILKTQAMPSIQTQLQKQLCVSLETIFISFFPRGDIWKSWTFTGKLKDYGLVKKKLKIFIYENHFCERTDVQIPCKVNRKEKFLF